MKLLSLDISMANTGFAVFRDYELEHYGVIPAPKYPLMSRDKYPKKTSKIGKMMAEEIFCLILSEKPDIIVIEEISIGGRSGIKSLKGICMLHGMLLDRCESILDKVKLVTPSGKDGWRTILQLKKNGDFKKSAVKMANQIFELELTDDQHDAADSILLGHSQLV